jgi:hypothetical protein
VIAVHVRPLSSSSSVSAIDCLGHVDSSGLLMRREESTNTVCSHTAPVRLSAQTPVQRTIQYAVSQYDNLLRRLAD